MLHAVIMAGGSGTRFWPASREAKPKQLLDLAGGKTMIEATVDRLGQQLSADRVLIVTNQRLVEPIAALLPDLPKASVIGEPCKRDTAPCVALAAALVRANDPDATMVVMPADHIIEPDTKFQAAVAEAEKIVAGNPEFFVTFGIQPTYPAESFGYIERDTPLSVNAELSLDAFRVKKFREKPNGQVAREYFESGGFYWNSGIFVWKASTILAAIKQYAPEISDRIEAIAESIGTDAFDETLQTEFAAIKGKSIDYAVMEHYPHVAVIPAPYEWDDVGNWQSLARTFGEDENGNTLIGRNLSIDTSGSIVRSDDEHLVVTVGLKDCIIVHTDDATLVANKNDEEAVRKVVELLKERGWTQFL